MGSVFTGRLIKSKSKFYAHGELSVQSLHDSVITNMDSASVALKTPELPELSPSFC